MKQSSLRKEFRRFRPEEDHKTSNHKANFYSILPFNFHRLKNGETLLVSEWGDWIVTDTSIEDILDRKISNNTIDLLLSKNFIHFYDHPPQVEFLANRLRAKKSYINGGPKLHILVISLRCEHTCGYCQVSRVSSDKEQFDMSNETIDKALHLIFQLPDDHLTIEFQGGEALLNIEGIKYAVKRARYLATINNKNVTFVICTNLAVLDHTILDFLKQENILISASLDGPANVHNTNRIRPGRDSYQRTIDGINLIKNNYSFDQVSVLMTTTNKSLENPKIIIDEYLKQGFKNIFLRPISPYGFATFNKNSHYEIEKYLDFYKEGLEYIIELNKKGVRVIETYAQIILRRLLTPYSDGYVDLMSPAGAVSNVIVYDYNGKIYASDEARMLAQMKDDTFCLGTVNDDWDKLLNSEGAITVQNAGVGEALPGCSNCALLPFCGSDPIYHHATQGDSVGFRPTSGFCKRNMWLIEELVTRINSDPIQKKIFQTWLKR